ncbi:MAG: hypothetical protein KZQ93_12745 [Candidatus Thiodiazotropha sp. (ex Monitilora ramsayi)]|nr:hypothetical protein [Candidatus Thiodiazotropha sp. (ex Monitilora ramsayi)]
MNEQQRQEVLAHVTHNLAFIPISADLYTELEAWSRRDGGSGGPGAVAAIADHQLWSFLERMDQGDLVPKASGRGYHWQDPNSLKVLELPHGSEVRTQYYGEWKTATVQNGVLMWEGKAYSSPSKLCNAMRGDTNNNAWKEFEVKRPSDQQFRRANFFRR